jgi:acetylornithine deacetylase/succinyl-diaminopimelate desuccinylase-like protein
MGPAKITTRLVPDQEPNKIIKLVTAHLKRICPRTVRIEVGAGHGAEPYVISAEGYEAQAALRALRFAFGREPVLLREGGSIPIVNVLKRILKADSSSSVWGCLTTMLILRTRSSTWNAFKEGR